MVLAMGKVNNASREINEQDELSLIQTQHAIKLFSERFAPAKDEFDAELRVSNQRIIEATWI